MDMPVSMPVQKQVDDLASAAASNSRLHRISGEYLRTHNPGKAVWYAQEELELRERLQPLFEGMYLHPDYDAYSRFFSHWSMSRIEAFIESHNVDYADTVLTIAQLKRHEDGDTLPKAQPLFAWILEGNQEKTRELYEFIISQLEGMQRNPTIDQLLNYFSPGIIIGSKCKEIAVIYGVPQEKTRRIIDTLETAAGYGVVWDQPVAGLLLPPLPLPIAYLRGMEQEAIGLAHEQVEEHLRIMRERMASSQAASHSALEADLPKLHRIVSTA